MAEQRPHVCPTTLMTAPTVAILGLGLMGASAAAAFRRVEAAAHLVGYDINPDHGTYCAAQKMIHAVALNAAQAVEAADIVLLAAPIAALESLMREIAPHLKHGAVVTDVSSVKASVAETLRSLLPEHAHLVPAHPIAGKSEHGPQAADADLFTGRLVVLTPERDTTPDHAISAVTRLWEMSGAHTERMAASNHDIIYAYVSHLPQMMAYAACRALENTSLPTQNPESFARFIRLGSSDPHIWTEIAFANSEALGHALEHVLATVQHMRMEFAQGTAEGHESSPSRDVATRLFPMLACASLVSALNQFEVQNKIRLAPYGGTGFQDFTAPANENPEEALEQISKSYTYVDQMLARFCEELQQIQTALTAMDEQRLQALLSEAKEAHAKLHTQALAS